MSKKANITGNAISEFGYNYPNEWDNAASGILAYSDNKGIFLSNLFADLLNASETTWISTSF